MMIILVYRLWLAALGTGEAWPIDAAHASVRRASGGQQSFFVNFALMNVGRERERESDRARILP